MRIVVSSAFLASALAAQVAPGEAIQTFFNNLAIAPIEGLAIVNRNGTITPVTGLTAQNLQDQNAVALDPIDNSIWLGSKPSALTTHGLRRATLTGSVLGPATLVATLSTAPSGSISGIAFDQNCNPILTSGEVPPNMGGVFRVDRASGAVTNLLTPHPALAAGTANCVDVDPATGDIYFGVTGGPAGAGGRIYVLRGPFPNAAPPLLLGSAQPVSANAVITGVAYWPPHGADPARVYWTTLSSPAVGYIPAAGGASVGTPGVPTATQRMNWITYDRRQDDLWLCTDGLTVGHILTMTETGANTVVATYIASISATVPSCIDTNDSLSASLRVCPMFLPAIAAPITVEASLSGTPFDIGVIGIDVGGGAIVLVGLGLFDGSGTLSASFSATLAAGAPNRFVYYGASLAANLSAINFITGPLFWPSN